jgi:hypothetical protein
VKSQICDLTVEALKNRSGREAGETTPNKLKKSFCVKRRSKSATRDPVFKPVGLPEFQIGLDGVVQLKGQGQDNPPP